MNSDLHQFAGNLVDGVIKTVSESKSDALGFDTTEIQISDTSLKDNLSFDASERKT